MPSVTALQLPWHSFPTCAEIPRRRSDGGMTSDFTATCMHAHWATYGIDKIDDELNLIRLDEIMECL